MKRVPALVVLIVAGSLLLAACGGSDEQTKVIERTVTQPGPEATAESNESSGENKEASKPAESPDTVHRGGRLITVPNVVGKDHQLAQDTMQAAGLYALKEEDATGQGRLLLYDRNWTTVRQDPPAGTKAWSYTTITLYAKKDDE